MIDQKMNVKTPIIPNITTQPRKYHGISSKQPMIIFCSLFCHPDLLDTLRFILRRFKSCTFNGIRISLLGLKSLTIEDSVPILELYFRKL